MSIGRFCKTKLLSLAAGFGVEIRKHPQQRIAAAPSSYDEAWLANAIEQTLRFHESVPPFYGDDIAAPLQIAGAWRTFLQTTRPRQLAAIESKDKEELASLLKNALQNELVSGLWNYKYFHETETIWPALYEDLNDFETETGWNRKRLVCAPPFPGEWGLAQGEGFLTYNDAEHGRQARRLQMLLQSMKNDSSTVVELGGGYGGMVTHLARWVERPLTIVLLDIPLNLTTAYTYLTHRFGIDDVHLIGSEHDLAAITTEAPNKTRFVLAPTLLAEQTVKHLGCTVLHNAHSFSEMNLETVQYYLQALVHPGTEYIVETNSGWRERKNTDDHTEVTAWEIESMVDESFRLLARFQRNRTRYVTTMYQRIHP